MQTLIYVYCQRKEEARQSWFHHRAPYAPFSLNAGGRVSTGTKTTRTAFTTDGFVIAGRWLDWPVNRRKQRNRGSEALPLPPICVPPVVQPRCILITLVVKLSVLIVDLLFLIDQSIPDLSGARLLPTSRIPDNAWVAQLIGVNSIREWRLL